MRTAIVILNWNTKSYLKRFLPGILASSRGAEVIVADSGSTDGSMEMMAEDFPEVRRIELGENLGFTGGYNKALESISSEGFEYYLLLNSDIEVRENWLEPLISYMDSHKDCGVCGPKLHSWYKQDEFEYAGAAGGFIDAYGYPFCRGRVMKMVEKDEGQYDGEAKELFWVSGACLLIRARLFDELKLDKRFFAHMEEIDLCWRLQLRGWKVAVVPESVVYHLGGGTLPENSPWKLKLNFRNNLLMLENNLALTYALRLNSGYAAADARKALFFARLTIFKRAVLDGCSALVYLLGFKFSYFKAVLGAHKEWKEMRVKADKAAVVSYLESFGDKGEVKGLYPAWIIPKIYLRGKGIFKLIRTI